MTRVLIAPITVTPTKALTPSHLKGLLWVDVMYRATALVADVTYRYSNTTYNLTEQTLGFWEYLDRTLGDVDYAELGEEEIGELYVRYHAEPTRAPFAALLPYLRAVEESGWVHPASVRLIELWSGYYARLGMHDPGLAAVQPPGLGLDELVELLVSRDLCLDYRSIGGPVYLDATRHGIPLRKIITGENQPNYLACALRELAPLVGQYDEIALVHDRELTGDYILLQRVLGELGGHAVRVGVDRVAIGDVVRSSRHGGWQGYTPPALFAACRDVEPEALRLGMRLYFIAVLGKGSAQSFRMDLLVRSVQRARRLLDAGSPPVTDAELAEFVSGHRGEHRHVDPYRLISSLLGKARGRVPPVHGVAAQVCG